MNFVTSTNFILRKFIVGQDEVSLFQALRDPLVVKHMASKGITFKDCESIVTNSLEHWQENGIGSWGVWKEGQIVGWAGFKLWKDQELEVLIVLSPLHWGLGKGIFDKLKELAIKEFKLSHLYVLLPETRKSFRYMRRMGFEYAGEETHNGEAFKKFVLNLVLRHQL
jgi:N-acetylglutamate synthase-like GNAT family acetyltransferase